MNITYGDEAKGRWITFSLGTTYQIYNALHVSLQPWFVYEYGMD